MIEYKEELSEEEKEKIINDFLPFIKYTAYRLSFQLPPSHTVDDLISVGLMGLIESINNYEKGRAKLRTYAEYRIKGAMLDELRAFDCVTRSQRKMMKDIKDKYITLEKEIGRMPEDKEVADALDIPINKYYETLQALHGPIVLSFENFKKGLTENESSDIMEVIPDKNAKSPLGILEETNKKEVLIKLTDTLPEKEKMVLMLYYWEELTMKEIGSVLNLSEGRICQLHSQAIMKVRAKLDALED